MLSPHFELLCVLYLEAVGKNVQRFEATIATVLPLRTEVRGVESNDRGAYGSSLCRPVNLFTMFLGSTLVGFSLLNSLPAGWRRLGTPRSPLSFPASLVIIR